MYDIGKILVAGGGNSLASARTINLNGASPQVSTTASMATGRRQHNLTVLADGTVLATGGNSSGAGLVDMNNGVYTAELWNPATGTWRTLASEQVTRQYHSTALLLPDGRVLSSGGGICGACDSQGYLAKNAQVFSPPYLFKKDGSGDLAARPTITSAPGTVSYNADFTIGTPAPSSIGKVAMVRLGAVTHSVNMEQRYVPLSFTAGGGNLTATAPLNANIAPPGYYMLFVIGTDGVPSVASMVRVENDTSPPAAPSLTDTDPDSPANDNNPEVKGSAEAGSTVRIYSTADCTGSPLASGSAATFSGAGITTPVPSNQTTNLRATATDSADNASGCSSALAYTHDSSAPATPSLTDTDPDSPANDNNPEVKGSAEAGSTVRIYSTAGCTGSPLASGSAAAFNGAGITTPVAGDQTTNLRATATDSLNNASGCSPALAYTEDSTAPQTQVDSGPQGPTNDPTPSFGFSATGGAQSYECRFDSASFGPCSGPGDTHTASPQLADGAHTFEVRATDSAQNTDPDPGQPRLHGRHRRPQHLDRLRPPGPDQRSDPELRLLGNRRRPELRMPLRLGLVRALLGTRRHPHRLAPARRRRPHLRGPRHRLGPEHRPDPGHPRLHGRHRRSRDPEPRSTPTPTPRPTTTTPSVKGSAKPARPSSIYSTARLHRLAARERLGCLHFARGRDHRPRSDGDQTTNLRATRDRLGRQRLGDARAALAYTEDSSAPATPSLTDTDPDSPANDNNPEVKGSAEAGSTVQHLLDRRLHRLAARERLGRRLQRGRDHHPGRRRSDHQPPRHRDRLGPDNASGCSASPRLHRGLDRPPDPGRLRPPGPDQRSHPELRLLGNRRRPELRMPLRLGLVRSLLGTRRHPHRLAPARRRRPHLRGPRHRLGPEHRPDPGQPRLHGRHRRPQHLDRLRPPGPDQRSDPELRLLGHRRRPELRMPLRLGLVRALLGTRRHPHRLAPARRRHPHLRGPRHRLGPEHRPDPGQPLLHGRHRRPQHLDRLRPPGPEPTTTTPSFSFSAKRVATSSY